MIVKVADLPFHEVTDNNSYVQTMTQLIQSSAILKKCFFNFFKFLNCN